MVTLFNRSRNFISIFANNAAGTIFGQIVTLITIPAQLHYLGAEQYGLIVLFNSFVAAGALTDLGIGPTVLRFVARCFKHPKALAHVFASSVTIILMLSLIVTFICAVGSIGYGFYRGASLPVAGAISANYLAALIAVTISAAMLTGLGLNVIKGLRMYRAYAVGETSLRTILPILATLVAWYTKDAGFVLLTTCIGFIIAACISLRRASKLVNANNWITTNLRYFKRKMLLFGKWVWVQAIFGFLGSQADRFIVAATMSLSSLAVYAVALSVANAMTAALNAGGGFLLPEASARLSDKAWLTRSFVKFTFLFSALSSLCIIAFVPLAKPLLTAWLNADMALKVLPVLLPILWTVGSAASSVPGTQIINAMGRTRFAALLGVGNNCVLLLVMLVAGSFFGLHGVLAGKLMSVPIGFVARAITAKYIFGMAHPIRVAFKMVWPTIWGALVGLPLSWYFLT